MAQFAIADYDGPQRYYPNACCDNKAFDIKECAQRCLDGFMSKHPKRVRDSDCYKAAFACHILPITIGGYDKWDYGDITGRAVGSWDGIRFITGDNLTGVEIQKGQQDFIFTFLDPEFGMPYRPGWDGTDESKGLYFIHSWDVSRTLRGLVTWYTASPDEREMLNPVIRKMIDSTGEFIRVRGTDSKWGDYGFWQASDYLNDKPQMRPKGSRGWAENVGGGIHIQPMVEFANLTGYKKAIEIATLFANAEFGCHTGEADPEYANFAFTKQGKMQGHLHSRLATLTTPANILWLIMLQQTKRF